MGRRSRQLPEGWDRTIPDGYWSEALLSAVRQDIGALAAPRVIETLRKWQHDALEGAEPEARREARRWLTALGRAIAGEPATDDLLASFDPSDLLTMPPPSEAPADEDDDPNDGTIDAFQLPPKPNLRRDVLRASSVERRPRAQTAAPKIVPKARRVSLTPAEELDTDSRVEVHGQRTTTGASAPPEAAFEDDNPTTAFQIPEDRVGPPPPPPPPLPPPDALSEAEASDALNAPVAAPGPSFVFEEDEKPTRHIAVPEEVLLRRLDSAQAALADLDPEAEQEPERTQMAPYPPKPPTAPPRGPTPKVEIRPGPPPPPPSDPGRLAPKPGVIRRSSARRDVSATPRPRAAMHHVRTLHALLHAFVEELVPLSYERRSRRFWARWREVAGDRGVRRDFVEDLLRTAKDTRTLLCELIAEMQSVDPDSVYTLVDKLANETPARPAEPAEDDSPAIGPLVGASVPVDPSES